MADTFLPPAVLDMIANVEKWTPVLEDATEPLEAINDLMAETGAAAGDMAAAMEASAVETAAAEAIVAGAVEQMAGTATAAMGEASEAAGVYTDAMGRLRDANGRFVSSATAAAEATQSVADTQAAAADAASRVAELEQAVADATSEASDAAFRLAMASREVTGAGSEYAQALDAQSAATIRLLDLQAQLAEADAAAAAAADAAAGSTAALGDAQAAAGTKAATAGDEEEAASGKATKGLKLWALAAVAGVAISVKMAGDFQQSMTRLVTSAGETQGNLAMVSQGILTMSVATNTSTSELAAGMYQVESAGFHGAAGLKVLQAAAEGAQAEGADLATVSNAVTSGLNAYGLSASKATSFTNQMVTTVGRGKMTMQDLASSLSAVLPIAASYKISFAQVGGALATMTSMGVSARQGTQDLAHAIRSLGNPTNVATNEMSEFGISSTKVSQMLGGKTGLTGTIDYLSDAVISKMGKSGLVLVNAMNQSKSAAADATTMLGLLPKPIQAVSKAYLDGGASYTTWYNATKTLPLTAKTMADQFASVAGKAHGFNTLLRSGAPAAQTYSAAMAKMLGGATGLNVGLMLTGTHTATVNANVKAIAASAQGAGANVKGWGLIQQNFNFQLGAAEKSAQAVAITFGTVLLPVVSKVMRAVAEFGGFLTRNAAASKTLAIVIGVLLAGALEHGLAKALKSCVSGLQDMAKPLMRLVGLSGEQAGAAAAQAAATDASTAATEAGTVATEGAAGATGLLGAAMDALPIIAIIAAVIALGVGMYELYRHCQAVREAVADVGHFFVMLWHEAGGLKGVLIDLGVAFGVIATGGIGLLVVGLIELYKHCALVREIVADVAHFLEGAWDAAFSAVSRAVQAFAAGTLGWLRQQLQMFTAFWAAHGAEVREVAHAVWAAVSFIVMSNVRVMTDTAKAALDVLTAIFRGAFAVISFIARSDWAAVTAVTRAAWFVIGPIVRVAMALIGGDIRAGMAFASAVFTATWDTIRIVTKMVWSLLGQEIHMALQFILGVIGIVLDLITGHWAQAGRDLSTLTSNMFHDVERMILTITSGFGNLLVSAGEALIGGLIHGIEDMAGSAVGAVEHVGSSIVHGALSLFGISSPSKVFAEIGDNILLGLSLGITRTSPAVLSKFQTLLKDIVDATSRGDITQAQADVLGLKLGAAMKAALRQSIGQALGSGLQQELTTTGKITKASLAALAQIWDAEKGGLISFSQASALAKWVKADNARLLGLARQRAAVAKEIAAAQSLASSTASAAESTYSLSSAVGTGTAPASVKSIISTLKGDVAKIRKFAADVRKLGRMGLNKAYLSQLISMGPDAGGALAAELVSSGLGDIRQINAAEKQITAASNQLGDAAVSAMYTAGKESGKGFLAGLKAQEKAIEAVMAQIAAAMVKKIRKELGISSPSKVMFTHGQMVAQGLANGIASGVGMVSRAVHGLASATSLAGTRSSIPAGVLNSSGGSSAIDLHLNLNVTGEVSKQALFTANKQETYRYNVRNSGSITGTVKPGG